MRNYRPIFECCGSHMTYRENLNGYTLVALDCHDCPDKMFCNRLKVVVEEDVNSHKNELRISRMR